MTTLKDVDTIFGEDGAIKAFEAAKQAGKVRFLGFSAHAVEAAMALMDRFTFDTIMFPLNYATWYRETSVRKCWPGHTKSRWGFWG